ncbi:DUF1648 domain-containing protein [Salsipaludibacter albus]|uniref:DUF1648 domain-containing protein n=1 Tax=Salsipaludibacter albus TaxID=2849650 RepID=UPI001EE43652|nr:DUF1648 domain-containing protein [Salsipaludibacter albus]MBY5164367.1 DUF1648 domain-containing protein [Salsipaludibacter albus]
MRRIMIATVLSVAALALALAVVVGDLPDPVATHFGPDGSADGFSDRSTLWVTTLGIPAVVAGLLTVLTSALPASLPRGVRWVRGIPVGIVWTVGGIMLATLWPQRGLSDASDVRVAGSAIVLGLSLGIAATLAASRLAPVVDPPETTGRAPAGLPRADLADDATALWQGTTPPGRFATWLTVGLVGAGLVAGILTAWWLGLVLVAVGLLPLAGARFRVTIGPASVQVSGWLGGWPRLAVPLATVTAARASTMRAFEYGGPGLRLAVGQPITAVVTGTGPALDLVRTDDSMVRISLVEADRAAAVVNSLLDRRGHSARPDGATDGPG